MPDAVAPWVRKEAVSAENAREVQARRERAEASALAYEMRARERRSDRGPLNFYCSEKARSREAIE
jgi:hypothetical protein